MKNDKSNGLLIAIMGPDGSGKTTLVEATEKYFMEQGKIIKSIYGSKRKDQYLKITNFSFKLFDLLKNNKMIRFKILKVAISNLYLLFVHYPLEYIDNLFKYKYARKLSKSGVAIIFDRYPIDRIIPLTQTFQNKYLSGLSFKTAPYFVMKAFGYIYDKLYPMPDITFFLEVEKELLMRRRPDFYLGIDDALYASEVYRELFNRLKDRISCKVINSSTTAEVIYHLAIGAENK